MAKDTELEEVELSEKELQAKAIKDAEDAIVIGKGSYKSNKGKRLIAKGTGFEVTFID